MVSRLDSTREDYWMICSCIMIVVRDLWGMSQTVFKCNLEWSKQTFFGHFNLINTFDSLQQIVDLDEKNQILTSNIWLSLYWNDDGLVWNSTEYGGVNDIRVPPIKMWKPDILLYNSANENFDATFPTNIIVRNTGACEQIPPGIFKSTCRIDITWFPFDDQVK